MKKICFRFDVDTHVCLSKGMPNLLKLAEEEGVVFTFFVNMGKGFDRVNSIKNVVGRFLNKGSDEAANSLSMFTKLGKKEALIATFLNPWVGRGHADILKKASQAGHELGLHGGRSHSRWEKEAMGWGYDKLCAEISFGLKQFDLAGLPRPTSFASPAWQSPPVLQLALKEKGFMACADARDSLLEEVAVVDGLAQVPTNILSDSDDVGFIENYRAIGLDSEAILDEFKAQLKMKTAKAMVYEHPFYAGVHEIKLLRDMIQESIKEGFTITTVKTILNP